MDDTPPGQTLALPSALRQLEFRPAPAAPCAAPAAAFSALSAAGIVTWDWDLLGHELRVSENALALLGLSAGRLRRPEDLWALIVPEDRAAHDAAIDRALATWQSYSCQFRWTRPDTGQQRWLEERAGVIDDGRRLRAAGVLLDITERKAMEAVREDIRRRAEDLLGRQRAEQQTILDSVRALIWYKDADNRILRCNKAAAQWVGLRVDQIEGRRTEELFPEDAAAYHRDDLEVVRSGEPRLGIVEPLRMFDGSKRWVQTDKFPYRSDDGEIVGVIVFSLDVTERIQAEQVLRESEQTQREFVANVSHEFRTPVAAIKGFAETLRRGGLDDARNRGRFVRIIENHANRLQWLVEDLLTLSALESGTVKLKPEPLALADFVTEYARSVEALLRKAKISLKTEVPARLKVAADQAHFLQALENLIGNAIKYNRPGGRIVVSAKRDRGCALISVRDTGIGISPSHLPRIFDRFYRVNKGAASGATGLGLHIVRKIVEAHGGRIWAESTLGKGSTFHVLMPLAAPKR